MKNNSKNLWELIKSTEVDSKNSSSEINSFRSIGGFNAKLASWDPLEKSSRYYKSLLFSFASYLDVKIINNSDFKLNSSLPGAGLEFFLSKIDNRDIGQPVTINYYNNLVDIDYLLSIEEILFLDQTLKNSTKVLEIGPGFGRLTHSLLDIYPNIQTYYIIDLPWMLEISMEFLKKALQEDAFNKIRFISTDEYNQKDFKSKFINENNIDLCINIDSFQEMQTEVAFDYLDFIEKVSKNFYSKNAICKYDPSVVDIILKDKSHYEAALNMGLCKKVIDIYDTNALDMQKDEYLVAFCPSGFTLKRDEQCFGQYLYYQSALFEKN